jgi:hypothetical protein
VYHTLLPDGQIFGQITENRPQKYFLAGKNSWLENGRFCQKVTEKRQKKSSWQVMVSIPSVMQFLSVSYSIKAANM